MLVRMDLARIIIVETGDSQVIILKERDGERHFPILIGINEALAIDRRLKGLKTPRPLTHDLMASIITELGAELEKIVINDLRDHTFFAQLMVRTNGRVVEIDSRPSDAIALGAATGTPIYVDDRVLREVWSETEENEP
ncbi:MAG: bifunctional nuclease family protein [Phycisphaerae bacterium]|nr:bifunctional nuclease family protein [Phycisphaerae bacterium]